MSNVYVFFFGQSAGLLAVGFNQAAVNPLSIPKYSLSFVSLGMYYKERVEVLLELCMSDRF